MPGETIGPIPQRHGPLEDALALFLCTTLITLGVTLYAQAGLLTSGVAGMALLAHHVTGLGFGPLFFAINVPFFVLAIQRLGWGLALRTVVAVASVSAMSRFMPGWIEITRLDPFYAALGGGALVGMGVLGLFRHRAGLGGTSLLALYMQQRHGVRAGWVQLGLDAVTMLVAAFLLEPAQVLLSLLGAVVLNVTLGLNHRPGRYAGVS